MRGATECARRLRKYFGALRTKLGKVSKPTNTDAPTQLIFGILSRDVPESKAREALDNLRGMVVDFNELRVTPPIELAEMIGDYPDVRNKSEDIVRALNKVFAREHAITLDSLAEMPKKDMLAYLGEIDGLEGYTRARIRLLGLGCHAVPLDEAMWALARREKIVDVRCTLDEAQAFLERQISEDEAVEFFSLLHEAAWAEMGDAVRAGECERITSVPPDRTTTHMLQDVAPSAAPTQQFDELEVLEPEEEEPAKKAASTKKRSAGTAKGGSSTKKKAASSRKTTKRTTKTARGKTTKQKATSTRPRTAARSTTSTRATKTRRTSRKR